MREVFQNVWVRAGALLAALIVLTLSAYLLRGVLAPVFFAFIVAFAFDPVVDVLQRIKIPRIVGAFMLLGVLFLAALSLPLFILPGLITEGEKLASRAAAGLQDQWIDHVLERLPLDAVMEELDSLAKTPIATNVPPPTHEEQLIRKYLQSEEALRTSGTLGTAGASGAATGALAGTAAGITLPSTATLSPASPVTATPIESTPANPNQPHHLRTQLLQKIGEIINRNAMGFVVSNIGQIAGAGQNVGLKAADVVGSLLSWLLSSAVFIGDVALFLFMTIYLLNDYDHIIRACDDLTPPRFRKTLRRTMRKIDLQLRAFFRGQGMVCLCLGTMYGTGLVLCEAPFAVPLAIFGGVASFVPYLGLALTILPASLLTILVHGLDWHLGGVVATFCVANFLEGNFITPAIVGKQVGLAPVWVILAIMVFGGTFGFTGLLLAVPLAAVLKVIAEELLVVYRASAFFGAEPSLVALPLPAGEAEESMAEASTTLPPSTSGPDTKPGRR